MCCYDFLRHCHCHYVLTPFHYGFANCSFGEEIFFLVRILFIPSIIASVLAITISPSDDLAVAIFPSLSSTLMTTSPNASVPPDIASILKSFNLICAILSLIF